MASTNKTPQLGLNQWTAGDEVLRTDFNGDNAKLDAAVGALQNQSPCVNGHYAGDGTHNRIISVGFRPSFVLLWGNYGSQANSCGFIFSDVGRFRYGTMETSSASLMKLEPNGFSLLEPGCFNMERYYYDYVAFR